MIEDFISVSKNWRCQVLFLLMLVVILLVFAESDKFTHLLIVKALAFLFGYILYRLHKKWSAEGKINIFNKIKDTES